jgi:uncharacterized protein YrrD
MAQRSDHAQLLFRLRSMYQDARRSAELRDQEGGAIRQRIVGLRGGYRRAARPALLASLAEQAAHTRLAAQADQNADDLAQCVGAAEAREDGQGPAAAGVGADSTLKDTTMQKMNELFGKRVISQLTGEQIATVREVVLDPEARQIVALIISGGRSSGEQVVRMGQILGIGEYLVVDTARPLQASAGDAEVVELRKGAEQITGKKLMSASGEQFGTVGDMYLNRRGAIVGFELKHGRFSGGEPQVIRAADIQAVGKDAVIARTSQPVALSTLAAEETEASRQAEGGDAPTPAGDRDSHTGG